MNEPIGMTPAEICGIVLTVCGAIITISGAAAVIIRVIMRVKMPDRKQNERLDKLESDVATIQERLERGDKHFDNDNARISSVEAEMRETNKVIIQSLQALTAHALDGNNTQELKTSNSELNKYLLNKV